MQEIRRDIAKGLLATALAERIVEIGDQDLAWLDATAKATASAGGLSASDSSTDVKTTYGVGGAFHLNKEWSIHLDYDIYSKLGDDSTTGESTVNMFSLGVMYKF